MSWKNRSTRLLPAAVLILTGLAAHGWAADGSPAAFQRSYQFEATGDLRGALDALEKVGPEQELRYTLCLRRAWLNYCLGDHRKAIESYGLASQRAPSAVEPLLGLMLPQMAIRLWRDAEQTGRRVLKLDPKSYLGQSRLAWTLYNLGRYPEAEKTYAAVLEGYPADVEMRVGLGWALLKQSKLAEARREFAVVLAIAPTHLSASQGMQATGVPAP